MSDCLARLTAPACFRDNRACARQPCCWIAGVGLRGRRRARPRRNRRFADENDNAIYDLARHSRGAIDGARVRQGRLQRSTYRSSSSLGARRSDAAPKRDLCSPRAHGMSRAVRLDGLALPLVKMTFCRRVHGCRFDQRIELFGLSAAHLLSLRACAGWKKKNFFFLTRYG
jgi:hypothetical protein